LVIIAAGGGFVKPFFKKRRGIFPFLKKTKKEAELFSSPNECEVILWQ